MEFLNTYGSIASIIGLAIVISTILIRIEAWNRARRNEETLAFKAIEEAIASRAKSATTQGKRIDLFIYHQSLLSRARFRAIIAVVRFGVLFIVGTITLTEMWQMQINDTFYANASAKYLFGIDAAKHEGFYLKYHYLVCVFASIAFLGVLVFRNAQEFRHYRRISAVETGLINELGETVLEDQIEDVDQAKL